MAAKFISFTEPNPLNFRKYKKKPKNSSPKSFWAFLLSVFIYVSVFYVFDLSASTLLCTTKFWFFISNTLILIIAADFGAFSSSKEADYYNEEYCVKYSNAAVRVRDEVPSSFHLQQMKIVEMNMINDRLKEPDHEKVAEEKIINVIYSSTTTNVDGHSENHESEEKKPEMIISIEKKQETIIPQVPHYEVKKKPEAACSPSYSEKEIIPKVDAKLVLNKTLSAGHEENDEYSKMSDEELNRRVEEFIRSFNRQIRLQASKNRQNLHEDANFEY